MKYILIALLFITIYSHAETITSKCLKDNVACEYRINNQIISNNASLWKISHIETLSTLIGETKTLTTYTAFYLDNGVLKYYIAFGKDLRIYIRSYDRCIVWRQNLEHEMIETKHMYYACIYENNIKIELKVMK